jgi:hypothetical protein
MQQVNLVGSRSTSLRGYGLGQDAVEETREAVKSGILATLDPGLLKKLGALEDGEITLEQFNDKELKAAAQVSVALLALDPTFEDTIVFTKMLTDEVARRRRRKLIIAGSVAGGVAVIAGSIFLIRR